MNKETLKNKILIQHGIVKGLEKQSKVFKLKFDTMLAAVDLEIENAELEERGYGSFEDCGSFYKSMLDKAEGKKSGLKDSESILTDMVKLIKSEHPVLKQFKKEFIDLFGQDTFESEVQSDINEYGKIKAKSNEKELKDKKEYYSAVKKLTFILFSENLKTVVHKTNLDYYKKLRAFFKTFYFFGSEFFKYDNSQFIDFLNQEKNNFWNNLIF